ncbi:MAG: carbohydrate binding domain-containing protein [Fibrobacteria bacterium]|nr:carbohydrate binding domain-containing protein [Fibrobacteria bacterium]
MSGKWKWMIPVLVAASASLAGTQWDLKLGDRTATIYAPDNRDKPALVISMHGMGLGIWWSLGAMDYKAIADTANFVVAYPGSDGSQWDLGGSKDVDFIVAIIDEMSKKYDIDLDRVYATGFSMGGMMSWYLACKIPDKIAAIVGGNGYPLGGLSGCSDVRHVPALQIHGTADDFVSYSGFVGNFLPSQRTRYGCPANPVTTKPYPEGVNGRNAKQIAQPSQSFMEYWGPCEKNGKTSELALLSVTGMIHDWATADKANANEDPAFTGKPFDVNGTWEAWNFMRQWSLKGKVVPLPSVPASHDTVYNGGFDQGSMGWNFNVWGGGARGSVVAGEYEIEIDSVGDANSSIQLVQKGIILEQGKSYRVTFDARAASPRTLEANVEQDDDPWASYLPALQSFDLTTTKTSFAYTFTMTAPTDSNARITFNAGASTGTVYLDNVAIQSVAVGVQPKAPAFRGRLSWADGTLHLSNLESGTLQILDTRGRSRAVPMTGGRAFTGILPAGLYRARLLDGADHEFRAFPVLP